MLSLNFDDFIAGTFESRGYQLYAVRNQKDVLYVGISERNIWNRWFGPRGRMIENQGGYWYGSDSISQEIINHPPMSQYTIDLYTVRDAFEVCRDRLNNSIWLSDYEYAESHFSIRDFEPLMIDILKPALNGTYNRWRREIIHPEDDVIARLPPAIYTFDLNILNQPDDS